MDTLTKSERIYKRHLEQKAKGIRNGKSQINNAAIAREFHCSREWVRLVIVEESQRHAEHQAEVMARALKLAESNQNANDSLNHD